MNFTARDIVGMSAYEFYHLNDMMIVQDAHTDCELNYLFPDWKQYQYTSNCCVLDMIIHVLFQSLFFNKVGVKILSKN